MKISEFLVENKHHAKPNDLDWDDYEGEEESDLESTPHIVMQLRKAIDVDGRYPIMFKDGTKKVISLDEIERFLQKYVTLKTNERSRMQDLGSNSYEDFRSSIEHEYVPHTKPKVLKKKTEKDNKDMVPQPKRK